VVIQPGKERIIVNVKFVDRKGEPPRGAHSYAEKKVVKLDRFFRSDATATVTFTNQKKGQIKAEVAVNADGTLYRGESTTSDANASVDAAIAAIERQIRKYKTRLAKRLHTEELSNLLPADTVEEEEDDIAIIRSKKITIKPMSAEEAVLQMNLSGHSFFVFRNADNADAVAVVYARNDGGYGLIEADNG
jgi:putative sigma-54 modulation protein